MVKYTRRIYTLPEIKEIITPIARNRGVGKVYLFGSYARGDAIWKSDVDFRIESGKIRNLFDLGGLYTDLEEGLRKPIDIVTSGRINEKFYNNIKDEEILLYE
jgi:predicted nucleotidyltransferase